MRKCKCIDGRAFCFNSFNYIDFNLDRCFGLKKKEKKDEEDKYIYKENLEEWFYLQREHNYQLSIKNKIYCEKCKSRYLEFKNFEEIPFNLIISINRGDGFKNKSNVIYTNHIKFNEIQYKLVGIIKRIENQDGEYFISLNLDYPNLIGQTEEHSDRDVVMLFYQKKIKISKN